MVMWLIYAPHIIYDIKFLLHKLPPHPLRDLLDVYYLLPSPYLFLYNSTYSTLSTSKPHDWLWSSWMATLVVSPTTLVMWLLSVFIKLPFYSCLRDWVSVGFLDAPFALWLGLNLFSSMYLSMNSVMLWLLICACWIFLFMLLNGLDVINKVRLIRTNWAPVTDLEFLGGDSFF